MRGAARVTHRAAPADGRYAAGSSRSSAHGASDASIRNPVPTDIEGLLKKTKITRIFCTGASSYKYYEKYQYPRTGIHAVKLSSTSPANCAVSFERLVSEYQQIIANNS